MLPTGNTHINFFQFIYFFLNIAFWVLWTLHHEISYNLGGPIQCVTWRIQMYWTLIVVTLAIILFEMVIL